jgi:hypothetical protein
MNTRLVVLARVIAAVGIYGVTVDDPPGAVVLATVLMSIAVGLGVKAAPGRLPKWLARATWAAGTVVSLAVALLIHDRVVTGPLFALATDVPSVAGVAPAQFAPAIERARGLVRDAIRAQNLPGVSVAVGRGGQIVWSEGFGWRDIVTHTPVTPDTRFNIGTAATTVLPAAASLGLPHTGADEATAWSPEHVGEPEEDFPGFTFVRRVIFQPIGLAAPATPLADERTRFYVPRSGDDPLTGRWLMPMRALACCADGKASFSTPSDLVRVALAASPANINLSGELAGGTVMSLVTRPDGTVIAVTSNMAHAKTGELAAKIADVFTAK